MHSRYTSKVRDAYEGRVDIATDAARAVQATLDSPGWSLIQEILSAEVEETEQRSQFHPDRVVDQAVYAARFAYREGLLASREVAAEMVRFADHLERQFDQSKTGATTSRA